MKAVTFCKSVTALMLNKSAARRNMAWIQPENAIFRLNEHAKMYRISKAIRPEAHTQQSTVRRSSC